MITGIGLADCSLQENNLSFTISPRSSRRGLLQFVCFRATSYSESTNFLSMLSSEHLHDVGQNTWLAMSRVSWFFSTSPLIAELPIAKRNSSENPAQTCAGGDRTKPSAGSATSAYPSNYWNKQFKWLSPDGPKTWDEIFQNLVGAFKPVLKERNIYIYISQNGFIFPK